MKQKCLSTVLFLLSLFSLFSLLELKCLRRLAEWCRNVHTIFLIIDEIKYSVFRIHTTFQNLRLGKRKRFELYLSLTDFRSQNFSFYGWFFSFSRSSSKTATAFKVVLPETEDSLSNFSNSCRPFGAKILSTNQSSFLLPPSHRITSLDWPWTLSSVASTG